MRRITNENKLHTYIIEHWKQIFPNFYLIESRPSIYGFLSNKRIGYADFLFRKGKSLYIAELKFGWATSEDFWGSFKVLGYAKATELTLHQKVYPVVMLQKDIITEELLTLLYIMKIRYILFSKDKEGYFFEYDFFKKE